MPGRRRTGTDASFLAYNPAAAAATDGGDISFSAVAILPESSARYGTALTSAGTPTGRQRHAQRLYPQCHHSRPGGAPAPVRPLVGGAFDVGALGLSTNYPATLRRPLLRPGYQAYDRQYPPRHRL